MVWFDRLFPVFMLAFPAVFTLFVRATEDANRPRCALLARRLWLATTALLLLHVAVQVGFETGVLSSRDDLRSGFSQMLSVVGFFPLWFVLAAPLLAARHPGWRGTQGADKPVRAASLTPRHLHDPVPTAVWVMCWLIFAGCVGVTLWSVIQTGNPIVLVSLIFWPGFAWGARVTLTEGEPRDAAGSPELAAAWDDYRRFRAYGFLGCGLSGGLLFSATAVLMVMAPESAGLVGGIGGASVGLLGGIFGTVASVRRARVNALLATLDTDIAA